MMLGAYVIISIIVDGDRISAIMVRQAVVSNGVSISENYTKVDIVVIMVLHII